MIRFMLDTNTCIYLIKYHPESIRKKLSSIPVGEVAIFAVVSAELWYGVSFGIPSLLQTTTRNLIEFLN